MSAVVELATARGSTSRPRRAHRTGGQAARGAHRGERQHRAPAARRPAGSRDRSGVGLGLHPRRELAARRRSSSWSTRRRCSTPNWRPGVVEACRDGTHLLLVGDPAQLPSIGPGRVLGDLVDSGGHPDDRADDALPAGRGRHDRPAGDGRAQRSASRRGRPGARGGHRAQPRQRRRRPPGGPARHRLDPAGAGDSQRRHPGRHPGAPRAGGHRGAQPGAQGGAQPGRRCAPRQRTARSKVSPARRFDVGDRIVAIANHLEEGFANGEVGTVTARTSDGLVITFSGVPGHGPDHVVERSSPRLGDHRASGAGQRVARRRRGAAAGVGRAAHPAAGLHRPHPGAAAPLGGAGGGLGAGPGGPGKRWSPARHPAAAACLLEAFSEQ